MSFTIPPPTRIGGQSGFMTDIDALYAATAAIAGVNVLNSAYAGGADPSGVADSTAAIQAAISAAGAGTVFLPPGTYKISSALTPATGLSIVGAGMGATIITQTAANTHGISGVDVSQITIRDLELNGTSAGTGNGINIVPSSNANVGYIEIANVLAGSWGNIGVHLDTPIVSNLRRVLAFTNGGDGIQLSNAKGTPTSVTLTSCYAKSNGFAGYEIDGGAYITMNGCASDSNPDGYALFSCQSVTLNGCGTENFTTVGYLFDGCAGCTLNGGRTFNGKTSVCHVTDGTVDQTIIGLVETSPASGATSSILTDSGTSSVIINPKVITAASYASSTAYVITSAGGVTH